MHYSPTWKKSWPHRRTHAVLGTAIPGWWVPVSAMKIPSLVSVLRPLRIPLVICPLRRTYVVVVRWTDELLCGGYKWVSRFEAPCICTHLRHLHLRRRASALCCSLQMNWWVVVRRVQMGVSIWHVALSHSMAGCSGSMARSARDSLTPLRRSSEGWMPARIGRLSTSVGRRHPVTIRKASFMTRSIRCMWALRQQAGAQYSAYLQRCCPSTPARWKGWGANINM